MRPGQGDRAPVRRNAYRGGEATADQTGRRQLSRRSALYFLAVTEHLSGAGHRMRLLRGEVAVTVGFEPTIPFRV